MDKRRQDRRPADPTAADGPGDGLPVEGADSAHAAAADAPSATESVEPGASLPRDGDEERLRLERALEAERDKHLRLAAEFDNYRKRSSRERQEAGWRAQSDLVLGLLEPLDDIMRFAHLDPSTVDAGTLVEGVALVERKVLKSLSGHGLEVVNPADRPFDPAFHEAVATEPALSREDDHMVARVYQPGYVFRGQLLRPARVVVKQWPG
jgi:molecular chaperone GrpE